MHRAVQIHPGFRVKALREEVLPGESAPIARQGEVGRVAFLRDTCHGPMVGVVFQGGWLDAFEHELGDSSRFEILNPMEVPHEHP